MMRLVQCSRCQGFLPRGKDTCPHCARRALTKKLCAVGATLGAGSLAFTLMACYGMPPCPDGSRDCHRPPNAGESEGGMPLASPDADGGK
jgi:hypothetical protein